MRLPRAPQLHPSAQLSMLVATRPELARAEQDGRYLHWEELRHRPAPAGVSHEQWWQVIKLARLSLRREIPLHDVAGEPFTYGMTDTAYRLAHEIEADLRLRPEPEAIANQTTRERYARSSLLEEALRSSQLEGATTTRLVAKEMIRTRRPPRNTSERMVLNNFNAMEWVRENKAYPLTRESLQELHSIITEETLDAPDGSGRWRRMDESIALIDANDGETIHMPPPADTLSDRMAALCRFANATDPDTPPVVRAILLHFWLAYDHPFVDGNGRTARALFYWSMLNRGYAVAEFIAISRVIRAARRQYEKAFVFTETDGNDTTYFILNQLRTTRSAIDSLHQYLQDKREAAGKVEALLKDRIDLNERQLALLAHALEHPDARFTIEGHKESHGVVYETARTDLTGLVRQGYLEQSKIGRTLYFIAVRSLDRKLRAKKK